MNRGAWWRIPLAVLLLGGVIVAPTLAVEEEPASAEAAPVYGDGYCQGPTPALYVVTCSDEAASFLWSVKDPAFWHMAYVAAMGLWEPGGVWGPEAVDGEHGCSYGYYPELGHEVSKASQESYGACVERVEEEAIRQGELREQMAQLYPPGADPVLDPGTLSVLCGIFPFNTYAECEGEDVYEGVDPAAQSWYESGPTGWLSPVWAGTEIPENLTPTINRTMLSLVLNPSIAGGTLASPTTLVGSEVMDGAVLRHFSWQVGMSLDQWCWRSITKGSSGTQTGVWACETYGGGLVAAYIGYQHQTTSQFFSGWGADGDGPGVYGVSYINTNTINAVKDLPITQLSDVGALNAIQYVRVYTGTLGNIGGAAPSWQSYNQTFQSEWEIAPTDDPDLTNPWPIPDETPEAPPAVPVPIEIPEPAPVPEPVPTPTEVPETGEEGWFDALGNRLGGMFDGLASFIGSGLSWFFNGLLTLFQWLVDRLWEMFEWLFESLASLLSWIGALLLAILNGMLEMLGLLAGILMSILGALGGIASTLVSMLGALWELIASLISGLAGVVGAIASMAADLALGALSGLGDILYDLFVPTTVFTWPACEATFPCNWVEEGVATADGLSSGIAGATGCAAPTIGWSEFEASFPPPPGCSGAASAGASEAGDLFGWRSTIRTLLALGLWLGFLRKMLAMAPWSKSGDMPIGEGEVTV